MAEWLKALVLKTRDGNIRRFESCPFRQISKSKACFGFSNLKEWARIIILSFPPFYRLSRRFLVDVDFGAGGGVDTEIGEDD